MPHCKNCNENFHACSSCEYSYFWEYEYCSLNCYKSSEEYKHFENLINIVINSNNENNLQIIKLLLDSDVTNLFIEKINNKLNKS